MTQPPQRIHTHQIDTRACSIISTKFSHIWEIRDLTGKDFGVDKKTLTAMNNQEVNSDFYTKVIKNNLKYENQLYDE